MNSGRLRHPINLTVIVIIMGVVTGCFLFDFDGDGGGGGGGGDYIPQVQNLFAQYNEQGGYIEISWDYVFEAQGYDIWVAQNSPSGFSSLAEVWDNSYNHENLQSNTTYYYQVRAHGNGVYSDFSSTVSATTGTITDGGGGGTSGDALLDQLNNWSYHNGSQGENLWFYFIANPSSNYEIQFMDAEDSDGSTSANITVSVYQSNKTVFYNGANELATGFSNPIQITVPSYEERVYLNVAVLQTGNFALRINQALSSLLSINPFQIDGGAFDASPVYDQNTFNYTLTIRSTDSSLPFSDVWPSDLNATVTVAVDGSPISYSYGSFTVSGFSVDVPKSVAITVTSRDNSSESVYTIVITQRSGNVNLSSLVPSAGTLDPAFDVGINEYTLQIPGSVDALTITPTAEDANASITVNNIVVNSGESSNPETATFGLNDDLFVIVIEAPDGSQSISYRIDVTRLLTGDFAINVENANAITYDEGLKEYSVELEMDLAQAYLQLTPDDSSAEVVIDGSFGATAFIDLPAAYQTVEVPVTVTPDNGSGVAENFTIYLEPSWTNDAPGDQSTLWYSFSATAGNDYLVQWDDLINGSGKYASDVILTAYHQDQSTAFSGAENRNTGYDAPLTITAASSEIIYLKVNSLDGGYIESFGLRVYDVTADGWVAFIVSGGATAVVE